MKKKSSQIFIDLICVTRLPLNYLLLSLLLPLCFIICAVYILGKQLFLLYFIILVINNFLLNGVSYYLYYYYLPFFYFWVIRIDLRYPCERM